MSYKAEIDKIEILSYKAEIDKIEIRNANYLRWIEDNPQSFNEMMSKRQEEIRASQIVGLYQEWKKSLHILQQLQAELNALNKIPSKPTEERMLQIKALETKIKDSEISEMDARRDLAALANFIPNILDPTVPAGKSAEDNVVLEEWGERSDKKLHHEDIAIEMKCWGRNKAVEMSGSRFVILEGELARLERALFQFVADYIVSQGFYELSIPYIVNRSALFNSGQLPKFEEAHFKVEDRCLIPTGEVALVNYFAKTTISKTERVCTLSQCFRSEAGSLGRDTKGMIRTHQFTKVEMVCITSAEESAAIHLEMLGHSRKILELLGIPYRVVDICSGDIGFTAIKQYDLEAWMPGQGKYVEVASCSNCGDFQAQRAGIKFKNAGFAHTLNATAVSGRVLVAILENHYDGKLSIPEPLLPYLQRK